MADDAQPSTDRDARSRDAARDAASAVWDHAWRKLANDAEFVCLVRAAAEAMLAATAPPPTPIVEPPPAESPARPSAAELAEQLTFARPATTPTVVAHAPPPPSVAPPDLAELPRLADRFAARSAIDPDASLARTFANVAEVLRLTHVVAGAIDRAQGGHEAALRLLAESLSAALVAVQQSADDGEDGDDGRLQHAAYDWLLRETKAQQVYIDRHMRRDDAARPADAANLAERIASARRAIDGERGRRQAFNKLGFHLKRLDDDVARGDRDAIADAWRRAADCVAALVREHRVPPSDVGLREALAPRLASLPDELEATSEFDRTLRAIDSHAASRAADDEPDAAEHAEPATLADDHDDDDDDDVARVRDAIAGKTLVLIGGQSRPHTRAKLEDALGVSVVWAESREHESPFNYAAEVVRPEVAAVVLTIRWMSHAFRDVTPLCRAHGVPVVSLKAGSNPARVARAIREQAGQRLGIDPA